MDLVSTKYMLFIGAALALIITPGPDMIFVISRGVSQGRIAGLLSAFGVCTGIIFHTFAAALGLAILLQTSALVYFTIKYLGAIYLLYLGIKCFTNKQGIKITGDKSGSSRCNLFWQGFLTNLLNPKIALFFLSFLPQFVDHKGTVVTLQMIVLGLTYFFLSLMVLTIIALLSGKIGSLLINRNSFNNKVQWVPGTVLIGLGISLALPGSGEASVN